MKCVSGTSLSIPSASFRTASSRQDCRATDLADFPSAFVPYPAPGARILKSTGSGEWPRLRAKPHSLEDTGGRCCRHSFPVSATTSFLQEVAAPASPAAATGLNAERGPIGRHSVKKLYGPLLREEWSSSRLQTGPALILNFQGSKVARGVRLFITSGSGFQSAQAAAGSHHADPAGDQSRPAGGICRRRRGQGPDCGTTVSTGRWRFGNARSESESRKG